MPGLFPHLSKSLKDTYERREKSQCLQQAGEDPLWLKVSCHMIIQCSSFLPLLYEHTLLSHTSESEI